MKCISCQSEINPKWSHAIDINICPFCGSNIMEGELKDLLKSLSDTLIALQKYPTELNDWLQSNFSYYHKDSIIKDQVESLTNTPIKNNSSNKNVDEVDESKVFTVKVKTDSGEEEVEAHKIQEDEITNQFFKRAEAVKPNIDGFKSTAEKTEHLKRKRTEYFKKITQQIKRAGDDDSSEYQNDSEDLDIDENGQSISDIDNLFEENNIQSSISSPFDDEIPPIVLQMANQTKSKGGYTNPADLIKLQNQYNKLSESRKNFESGASRGKGGFSRS